MRLVLSASLLAIAFSASEMYAQQLPLSRRQVISAETIRGAGITRLSELPFLANEWDASTVEGFAWQLSPRALSSYQRQNWDVMVDGKFVDLELFGAQSLNRLPITLSQIDSVEFLSAPGMRGGAFVDAGLIRIYMRRPSAGLSVRGYAATANETGDPGPFRFTDMRTPNIDRIGSNGSGVVSYRHEGFFGEVSATVGEHFVRDPPIRRRNQAITAAGEIPIIKHDAFSLRAGLETRTGAHEIFLGHSSTRDYYFLKPFGREVPTESPFTHAGISGSVRVASGTDVRYRATYSTNELDEHANTLDLNYDWRTEHLELGVEARRTRPGYDAKLGASYRRTSADTDFQLDDDGYDLVELSGAIDYRLGSELRQALDLSVVGGGDDLGFRGSFNNLWHISPKHDIEAGLAYTERIPEEDGRIWYWFERGYSFLADNGVDVAADDELAEARRLSFDVDWRVAPGASTTVTFGGYIRAYSDLLLEDQRFAFDSSDETFSGPVRLTGDQGGEVGGASLTATSLIVPRVRLEGFYRFQDVAGGDSLFEAAWKAVPDHVARASAMYRPLQGLSVWGIVDYRSWSEWGDYVDAEEQSDGLYRFEIDGAVTVSLAAEKWFWDRRLRLNLQLRNLFSDTEPRHPIGAEYDLTLVVQGELLLDGVWSDR